MNKLLVLAVLEKSNLESCILISLKRLFTLYAGEPYLFKRAIKLKAFLW